jgi:hypothetical protein
MKQAKPYICHHCGAEIKSYTNFLRHMKIHEQNQFPCNNCNCIFKRKGNLQRHKNKLHHPLAKKTFPCHQCDKTYDRQITLDHHLKTCKLSKKDSEILEKMKEMKKEYEATLNQGRLISELLHKHEDLSEDALSQEFRHCLQQFRHSCLNLGTLYEEVTLRPWQKELMAFLNKPSQHQVIWVVGSQGNEGKTFIQNYIHHQYGDRRVVMCDITGNKKHIAHYLAKVGLGCKDIFLFNQPCSSYESVAYDLLEGIKDGLVLSHKYQTEQLKFNTPNTVMVFSNNRPNTAALKKDIWLILEIKNDQLLPVTSRGHHGPKPMLMCAP